MKTLLTLAVFVVIVAGLYLGREVLIPVTLAVLLSFILAPLANLIERSWLIWPKTRRATRPKFKQSSVPLEAP